jgi:glycosyltransferase involved in cell wall biosynthesis
MTKTVRIYSPYSPTSRTEGSFQVIDDQARSLKELGFQVEMIHWKSEKSLETVLEKTKRVLKSITSNIASPEDFYYPASAADIATPRSVADIGIYHYSFAYNWLRLPQTRPEKKKYVYFHNLESELFRLRKNSVGIKTFLAGWIHLLNELKLRSHEGQLPSLVDEAWFLSRVDLDTFCRLHKNDYHLRLITPGFDPHLFLSRSQVFQTRNISGPLNAGILGRFDFEPNRASLAWLIEELAPELKKRNFKGQIRVAGKGVPRDLIKKSEHYGFFEFLGFVENLEEFWASLSFLLIPQKGGSGIRMKLLEALASGVPVLVNQEALLPLTPSLQASPLIFCSEVASDWATQLVQEKPFEARKTHLNRGFEKSLLGTENYRFLLVDSPSS